MRKVINGTMPILVFASALAVGQGVHTWYGNEEFMHQLDASIASFFGDSVGAYIPSARIAYVDGGVHASNDAFNTKISNQFLAIFGNGAPGMQQLFNQRILYEFNGGPNDGLLKVAIVTPQYSTTVLAAAIVHYSCGYLSPHEVNNASEISKHFGEPKCNNPIVTIFFRNQTGRNPIIRKELASWGTLPLLKMCRHDMVHTVYRQAYVAKYGHQPPRCEVKSNVVVLNP